MSFQQEFMMPGEAEELWMTDSELPLKVQNLIEFGNNSSESIEEVAEGITFKLCDDDPLCVIQQQNFDQLCSVIRCFDQLEGPRRRQLLDALCSSLTCLNAWIDKLLSTPADAQDRDVVGEYRGAFKAYLFFLHWIAKTAAREDREASVTASAATSGRGRGRKKATDDGTWDWPSQCAKVMKTVGQALNTDLWALFRPNRPEENVLVKLTQLAASALEMPAAAKDEELAAGAAHVLAISALKYQQLDSVAGALVDALNNYEHTPPLVAELLRYSISQWDDGRLAATVIADIAGVDPSEYERQQNATGEKAGVRSVASFVEEMASRLPKLMAHQIALLLPHLGGKAWTLRSSIVTAIGYLLHKAFEAAPGETNDAQIAARLRSKQHLLDILCERVRDQSSFTRKAVLQTWQYLAEARAIPLGHWQVVTTIAVGRLEDKSSLVRKEALRLLASLMLHNPFGPSLPMDRFAASLAVHKTMLDQVQPPDEQGDDFSQEVTLETVAEGEEGADANGAAAAAVVKPEPNAEGEEEEMEVEVETNGEEEDVQEAPKPAVQGKSCAEVGWDGTVEELQALVASLELAVDFSKSLSACMPTLVQLLASSTLTDVQESIALLLTCKQFDVAGAPDAIRKMLPLVFARDQGKFIILTLLCFDTPDLAVKDRIVEALDQLYITGWAGNTFTSAQAARNLIELASGATLGELGSMEEVVKEFLGKGFVTPVTLHELWDVAGQAATAVAANAQGAGRARRDLRASMAVLSMAALTTPQSFGEPHVRMLLQYGFAGGRAADALTTRHACLALQRLAENFKTGAYDHLQEPMYAAFVRTVVASPFSETCWYSAAEASIAAIYALHPSPELICAAVLRRMAVAALAPVAAQAETADGATDADAVFNAVADLDSLPVRELSRFFFVLGHVALEHLVLIERLAKTVRRSRNDAEKRAAEARSERLDAKQRGGKAAEEDEEEEDINAELGVGSVTADAELDAMKDACESQILSASGLLGPYAKIVSTLCHNRSLLASDATLRSSALLALSKIMVVDPSACEANLQLMFTLLQSRSVEPALRSNLVIALGDLALRFPNLLEPWTEHIYRPLGDPDASVRKNTLMVLTHLILNDMMKVKGHIAKMAVCLEDNDARIAALAQLFFHELAKKEYKGTSPIYNLLPDILSNLSRETGLSRADFQSVMQQLLGYIKKDKQGDALVEKLCQRFASTQDETQWRNVAFCLAQLPLSEKGVRKLAECFKMYKGALLDGETADAIGGILTKAKKNASKPEVKALVEELEAKIIASAAEMAEEEEAAAAAAKRAQQDREAAAPMDEGEPGEEQVEADDNGELDEASALQPASSDAASLMSCAVAPGEVKAEIDAVVEEEEEEIVSAPQEVEDDTEETAEAVEEQEQEDEEENAPLQPLQRTSSRRVASQAPADEDVAPARPTRGTRRGAAAAPVKQEEGAEEAPAPARRSTRAAKTSDAAATAEADVLVKARRGRRAKVIADSDGENESSDDAKIAAVQAGMRAVKVEDDQ